MTLTRVNNAYVNEDLYKFPEPDLLIQSVTKKSDLNALGIRNTLPANGYVYFYIDRDWENNTVNYVGETKNGLQYRHNATHSKKEWFANLKYPLIGIAQSPYRAWDTDTRRIIESLVLRQLKSFGLTPANYENATWIDFDISGHPEQNYLERVAEKIVEYQVFHAGLVEKKPPLSFDSAATPAVIIEIQKEVNVEKEKLKRNGSPTGIWLSPTPGRKIIAKRSGCIVKGYQTANGLVVVTEATNIPLEVKPSATDAVIELHKKFLSESTLNREQERNWIGSTEPAKPTKYLAGIFGVPSANIWEEDL